MIVFVASLLILGLDGLIPLGLLLAFSTDSDEEQTGRSVILTPRNLGLAAAMMAAFAWFWLWHLDLSELMLVVIAGALIALPLALQDSAADVARDRTVVVTKRSLILAVWGLVVFVDLYYAYGTELQSAYRRCVSSCLSPWSHRGCGALTGGGSSSDCSATPFAGRCEPTSLRASTSGCAAGCSGESWPPVACTSRGSGSP